MSLIVRELGREQHYDPRNENFRIREVVAQAEVATFQYHYDNGVWLDQGAMPACTAFAASHYRDAGPVRPKGFKPDPVGLYRMIQAQDRVEGRHYSAGATSLAMAKVMKAQGWLGEYRWGYTLDELVKAVLLSDCVCVGTNWYEGMSYPTFDLKSGRAILNAKGTYQGGHEYLITGINTKLELFRVKNSWGRDWANQGRAWISFTDMQRLIEQEDGDVMLSRELPVV
jgi:hypothetical protein